MYTDEKLASSLKLRDMDAIHYMYFKYAPALFGYIQQECNAEGEHILFTSVVKIVTRIQEYDPVKCRMFTWMYWIVTKEISTNRSFREQLAN